METSNPPETAPATDTEKIETVLDTKLSELNITDEIKLNSKPTTVEQSPEVEPSVQEAVSPYRNNLMCLVVLRLNNAPYMCSTPCLTPDIL